MKAGSKEDTEDADHISLLAHTLDQARSQQYNIGPTAGGIDFYGNTDTTEYMRFKRGTISTLSHRPKILIYNSTYLVSNISSIESDINVRQVKLWITIDTLWIIWKSDLTTEISRNFF